MTRRYIAWRDLLPEQQRAEYEAYLAELSEDAYEPGPYVPPPVFGRPKGWQPSVEYGFAPDGRAW